MKLITFSLWGEDPKYTIGALKNVALAKEIYPDWFCRFYIATSVPIEIVNRLSQFENVELVKKPDFDDWRASLWRFEPISDSDVDFVISRDCDSRLNYREKGAVEEWLRSDKGAHTMIDHPGHQFYIMPGMCGFKRGTITNIGQMLKHFLGRNEYGVDSKFCQEKIRPLIKNNLFVHDSIFGSGKPFPTVRGGGRELFVAQVFSDNEEPVAEHLDALMRWIEPRGLSGRVQKIMANFEYRFKIYRST